MKKIAAAKFKEQCLAILDRLDDEGILVTKHGRPVARVVAFRDEPSALIGALRGRLKVRGDILRTGVAWDASG